MAPWHDYDDDERVPDETHRLMRGVRNGLIISVPIWLGLGALAWWLF